MGWSRKQYDKNGKSRRVLNGEKDWSREEKERIRAYQDKYDKPQGGTDERRKAS